MKNKNILTVLSLVALSFVACQKSNDVSPLTADDSSQKSTGSSATGTIGPVPATFTQKVLLENITGANHGKCPDNDYRIASMQTTYPDRIICTSVHISDAMYRQEGAAILSFLNVTSPSGAPLTAMNRMEISGTTFNDPNTWTSNINIPLNETPSCGLAIQTSTNYYTATANIHVGFDNSFTGNYKMCAYLVENNVKKAGAGYDQANDFNNDPFSPFYNMGNPIINYNHNNVFRLLLTPVDGYTVPSVNAIDGNHWVKQLTFDVHPSIDMTNSHVIAFVYDASTMQVINVQTTKLGTTKNWD